MQLDSQLKFLSVAVDGHVAVVTLDRPPVNAVSGAMYVEIRDFFADFDLNLPGVRVVVLTGRGRHFCAGNDLPEFVEMTPENAPGRMKTVREAFWAIYDCPVPVIAAVNGAALGTGLAITASCDFAICGLSASATKPATCRRVSAFPDVSATTDANNSAAMIGTLSHTSMTHSLSSRRAEDANGRCPAL